jgi:isoquinoline 1-oxidoreductase
MSPQLRKVAASAREVLIDLAAEALKEDRSTLSTSGGKITSSKTGKSLSFAELTRGRKLTEKIAGQPLTVPNDKWVTAGKPERKTSARAIVTGKQKYTPTSSWRECSTARSCDRMHCAVRLIVLTQAPLKRCRV